MEKKTKKVSNMPGPKSGSVGGVPLPAAGGKRNVLVRLSLSEREEKLVALLRQTWNVPMVYSDGEVVRAALLLVADPSMIGDHANAVKAAKRG